MSLLTNPFFQVGMGLLANSGPSLTPVNPYRGIAEGLFNAQQGQVAEQESAYRQWQMEQQKQEAERLSQQRQYSEQLAANAPPEHQAFARAYPDVYAKAIAERMTAGPADSVKLTTAGELGLSQYDPKTPVEVKYSGGQPVDYTVMEAPAPRTDGIKLEKGGQVYTAGSVDEANKMADDGWTYYKPPPSTSINNIPAPPSGYWFKDQNNPMAGYEAVPGGPATKPTDTQANAAGFASIMGTAGQQIAELEDSGIAPTTLQDAYVPDAIARPEIQQYRSAQRAWVRAKLRKESGATIGEQEMADEIRTYFPQVGDSPQVIADKRARRLQAEEEMRKQAGPANPGAPVQDTDVFGKYNLKRPPK